ncbi:hypothetical protein [Sporisorium scitamineum]|nr:hypothetical protein [Sporisorium scitamineum]
MESFQLDKRNNHVRDSSACRPNTSDGMSPNPRQAVFGHRPSPSEISLLSKRESSRSIAPADRDLILGLQGGTPKLRKPTEKKKSLPKPPDHSPPSHFRQASVNSSSSSTDVNMHWADPPPYRSPTESELIRGENLRKSQSLSTLRFGFNRRPGSTSPATEAAGPRASEHVSPPAHQQVEQSAWEAMLTLSPSTAGDHGSASSCTRTTRSEAIHTSPGKRTLKSHRLPPQKPPPQSCLPPPPPAQQPAVNKTNADATKSSFETYASCPSSTGDSSGGGSVQNHDRNKTLEFAISVKTSLDGSNRVDNSSSPQSSPPQVSKPLVSQVRTLEQNSQVELDIGGTKFVTLVSTLQGAPDDQPRLLDLLQRQQVDSNASTEPALCRQGVECELGGAASKSNISLSTSRSGSVSHGESEASIRRTSDTSNASSWSKHTSEADDELLKQQAVPDASDWTTALPSSRLCSPTHFPPSPLSPVPSKLTPAPSPHSIFIDRNGDLYRDILDILRTRKLPYRLQASCLVNSGDDRSGMAALKLQLRCRLFEVKDEAEWLGYSSIVGMCEGEIARV